MVEYVTLILEEPGLNAPFGSIWQFEPHNSRQNFDVLSLIFNHLNIFSQHQYGLPHIQMIRPELCAAVCSPSHCDNVHAPPATPWPIFPLEKLTFPMTDPNGAAIW